MADDVSSSGAVDLNPEDLTIAFFVLPPIISLINQRRWASEVKALVALGVCLVYALGVTALRGDVSFIEWRNTALQVCTSAFAAYKVFWNPSGWGPAIEAATSSKVLPVGGERMPAATLDRRDDEPTA